MNDYLNLFNNNMLNELNKLDGSLYGLQRDWGVNKHTVVHRIGCAVDSRSLVNRASFICRTIENLTAK